MYFALKRDSIIVQSRSAAMRGEQRERSIADCELYPILVGAPLLSIEREKFSMKEWTMSPLASFCGFPQLV